MSLLIFCDIENRKNTEAIIWKPDNIPSHITVSDYKLGSDVEGETKPLSKIVKRELKDVISVFIEKVDKGPRCKPCLLKTVDDVNYWSETWPSIREFFDENDKNRKFIGVLFDTGSLETIKGLRLNFLIDLIEEKIDPYMGFVMFDYQNKDATPSDPLYDHSELAIVQDLHEANELFANINPHGHGVFMSGETRLFTLEDNYEEGLWVEITKRGENYKACLKIPDSEVEFSVSYNGLHLKPGKYRFPYGITLDETGLPCILNSYFPVTTSGNGTETVEFMRICHSIAHARCLYWIAKLFSTYMKYPYIVTTKEILPSSKCWKFAQSVLLSTPFYKRYTIAE